MILLQKDTSEPLMGSIGTHLSLAILHSGSLAFQIEFFIPGGLPASAYMDMVLLRNHRSMY